METSKRCRTCNKSKPLGSFQRRAEAADGRAYVCKECKNAHRKVACDAMRKKVGDLKVATGCAKCGYDAHPAALHFNHLDPSTKKFNIGASMGIRWDRIEEEIAKCEVLCANCHAIETQEKWHTYRS